MDIRPLATWVNERHAIYLRKELSSGRRSAEGLGIPEAVRAEFNWQVFAGTELTRDPILREYRFCNVFRELDRVSSWIRYHIQRPFAGHPDLWFMLAIARTINWPETLGFLMNRGELKCDFNAWPRELGGLMSHYDFSPEQLGLALDHWSALGNKVYTGAYMIRAESNPKAEWYSWTKQQYIARIVLGRLWEDRHDFVNALDPEDRPGFSTMQAAWEMFQQPRYIGWGPFMAYQVVVDLRHSRYLRGASDIQDWAALGPGSRRGLNRLAGRPVDYPLKQADGLEEMRCIHRRQDEWRAPWVPPIDLSDIQNCLCEVDKYLRVKTGEGKPRSKYIPGRGW